MNKRIRMILVCALVTLVVLALPASALAKSKPPRYPNAMLYEPAKGGLWRMNPDGTKRQKLANVAPGSATAWSPDHSQVAFIHLGKSNATTVWIVGANGKGAAQVKYSGPWRGWKYGRAKTTSLTWSRDGRSLAYADTRSLPHWYEGGAYIDYYINRDYVVIIDLKRHKSRQLAPAIYVAAASDDTHYWGYGSIDGLKYTPSGRALLELDSYHGMSYTGSILCMVLASNGHTDRWIDHDIGLWSADISPNGSIVYWKNDGGYYILMNSGTIIGYGAANMPWDPWLPRSVVWAPDGKHIAVSEGDYTSQTTEITVAKPDGTFTRLLGPGVVTSWR